MNSRFTLNRQTSQRAHIGNHNPQPSMKFILDPTLLISMTLLKRQRFNMQPTMRLSNLYTCLLKLIKL